MNLANRITIARICLIPVIMFFLLADLPWGDFVLGEYSIPISQLIGSLLFILAASTDKLDGHIARKYNLITNLGKLLDPLADKLLVIVVFVSLVEMGKISALIVTIIIARELAVTGLRQIALLDGVVVAASQWGKWKTVTQMIAIIALLLNNFPFVYVGFSFDYWASWLACLITLYSGIDYFVKNKALLKSR